MRAPVSRAFNGALTGPELALVTEHGSLPGAPLPTTQPAA